MLKKKLVYFFALLFLIAAVSYGYYLVTEVFRGFWSHHETLLAGIIGALASVVGGSLTLLGVRMTVTSQNKNEFIRLFPERLIIAEDLLKLFTERPEHLREALDSESFGMLSSGHILKDTQDYRVKSAKISAEFYNVINDFLMTLQTFQDIAAGSFKPKNKITGPDYHKQFLGEYMDLLLQMDKKVYKMHEEIDLLKKQYKKFTKV